MPRSLSATSPKRLRLGGASGRIALLVAGLISKFPRTPAPVWAVLGLCLAVASGCATNQATGRYQFKPFSREEEIKVGEEAMPGLVQEYGGVYPSPPLSAYVTEVGMRLVDQVEDPLKHSLPWEFTVLDSEIINAFALPGGKVFISVGLLREFQCEAQLAGVLGHEVGHVTADHAEQRIGQATTVQILGQVAGAAASVFGGDPGITQAVGVLVGSGGQGFLLKFSRDQESEADALGVRYMIRAGYDPQGLIDVMKVLKAASEGSQPPEMLSTHPYPETRLTRMNALLERQYPGQLGSPDLRMGCPEWESRAAPYLPPRSGKSTGLDSPPPVSRMETVQGGRRPPMTRPPGSIGCTCGGPCIIPASSPSA